MRQPQVATCGGALGTVACATLFTGWSIQGCYELGWEMCKGHTHLSIQQLATWNTLAGVPPSSWQPVTLLFSSAFMLHLPILFAIQGTVKGKAAD